MKKSFLVLALLLSIVATSKPVHAAGGIGIAAGQPSGLTIRFDRLVGTLGYSFYGDRVFGAVDYWFLNNKIDTTGPALRWYLGGGVFAGYYTTYGWLSSYLIDSPFSLGARVPVGLQYFPVKNIELYLEAAPGIQVLPYIDFDWQASIGIRFLIFR